MGDVIRVHPYRQRYAKNLFLAFGLSSLAFGTLATALLHVAPRRPVEVLFVLLMLCSGPTLPDGARIDRAAARWVGVVFGLTSVTWCLIAPGALLRLAHLLW